MPQGDGSSILAGAVAAHVMAGTPVGMTLRHADGAANSVSLYIRPQGKSKEKTCSSGLKEFFTNFVALLAHSHSMVAGGFEETS